MFSGCDDQPILSSSRERFLTVVSSICDRIETDYVKILSERDIQNGVLAGILSGFDSFSRYLSEEEFHKFKDMEVINGFGMELELQGRNALILNVYPNSPAQKAGIQPFDKIIEIDRKDTVDLNRLKFNSSVHLLIEREGVPHRRVFLKRKIIPITPVTFILSGKIATIHISTFNNQTASCLQDILRKLQKEPLKGLVLDLRNNAGGFLEQAVKVCSLFISSGPLVRVKYRDQEEVYEAKGKDWMCGVPMIVLINRYCASASEIVAGALKDYGRALIVGERTFGKGSVQSLIPLPGVGGIRLTIGHFLTPYGHEVNEKGIEPHISTKDFKNIQSYFRKGQ